MDRSTGKKGYDLNTETAGFYSLLGRILYCFFFLLESINFQLEEFLFGIVFYLDRQDKGDFNQRLRTTIPFNQRYLDCRSF